MLRDAVKRARDVRPDVHLVRADQLELLRGHAAAVPEHELVEEDEAHEPDEEVDDEAGARFEEAHEREAVPHALLLRERRGVAEGGLRGREAEAEREVVRHVAQLAHAALVVEAHAEVVLPAGAGASMANVQAGLPTRCAGPLYCTTRRDSEEHVRRSRFLRM